jgi:hypothetical protein
MADATAEDFDGVDLLVVGAPARMFKPASGQLERWLENLPDGSGRPAAVFESRVGWLWAQKMQLHLEHELTSNDWKLVVPPASFRAQDATGPLVWGEHGHAQAWGAEIATFATAAMEVGSDGTSFRSFPTRSAWPPIGVDRPGEQHRST